MHYTQYFLTKGTSHRVAWIPSTKAIEQKYLEIQIDGEWQDGWRVDAVYATHTKEMVENYERDYKTQREVSDI